MSDQPEALRLAARLETRVPSKTCVLDLTSATELRRQHSRIEADEALILKTLMSMCDLRQLAIGHANAYQAQHKLDDIHPVHTQILDRGNAAITALRKRLESSK